MWGWQGPRAHGARGRWRFPVCQRGGKRKLRLLLSVLHSAMAGPGSFPLVALLLGQCLDTGTSKAGLKLWAEDPMALGSPLQLHCAFPGREHITLVSWWHWGQNWSREDLAVIDPKHGAYVLPAVRSRLWVTNVSDDGQVGLTVPSLDLQHNDTRYCCKFSTFPSGVSEQCLQVLLHEPATDPSPAPHSLRHAFLRPDVLGTLGAGGFFLLGSILLLGHLLREWTRRRRKLKVSHPHPNLPSSQETPIALWVQQGLPGRRNSFSAPYVLINLDYFTPQPSATTHAGPLPPPVPPRPGRDRGQGPGQSRALRWEQERGRPPAQDLTLASFPSGLSAPQSLRDLSRPLQRQDAVHPSCHARDPTAGAAHPRAVVTGWEFSGTFSMKTVRASVSPSMQHGGKRRLALRTGTTQGGPAPGCPGSLQTMAKPVTGTFGTERP